MENEGAPQDIVVLTKAINPVQAHIWAEALAAEGIRCKVVGDYLVTGMIPMPEVSMELWVHRKDLARAEEILRRGQEVVHDEDEDEEES